MNQPPSDSFAWLAASAAAALVPKLIQLWRTQKRKKEERYQRDAQRLSEAMREWQQRK